MSVCAYIHPHVCMPISMFGQLYVLLYAPQGIKGYIYVPVRHPGICQYSFCLHVQCLSVDFQLSIGPIYLCLQMYLAYHSNIHI